MHHGRSVCFSQRGIKIILIQHNTILHWDMKAASEFTHLKQRATQVRTARFAVLLNAQHAIPQFKLHVPAVNGVTGTVFLRGGTTLCPNGGKVDAVGAIGFVLGDTTCYVHGDSNSSLFLVPNLH